MKKLISIFAVMLMVGVFTGAILTADNCGVISHSADNQWGGGGASKRWVEFFWQCGTNRPCTGVCHVTVSYKLYKNYMHQGQQLIDQNICWVVDTGGCCGNETSTTFTYPFYDSTILSSSGAGVYTLFVYLKSGDCSDPNAQLLDTFSETFTL